MTKKERFHAALDRRPCDRPPFWLGLPTPEAMPGLLDYFGARDFDDLKRKLDDDVWTVICPYHSPDSSLIEAPFRFAAQGEAAASSSQRTLTHAGVFAEAETVEEIEAFPWPDPKEFIDVREIDRELDSVPDRGYAVMGVLWAPHFQLALEAFGMEEALIRMKTDPELFEAVINRIVAFYEEANGIFLERARGRVDAVLIGNDFGTQQSLLCSPDDLRAFVFEGTRRLIRQAHSFGVRVVHHSCGAIAPVIGDLIDAGADAIHPIQARASGMEAESLRERFGDRASFCGGLDAQYLLVQGSQEEIRRETERLMRLFPTGLVVSPSHEAILPDIPPENIAAFAEAVKNWRN